MTGGLVAVAADIPQPRDHRDVTAELLELAERHRSAPRNEVSFDTAVESVMAASMAGGPTASTPLKRAAVALRRSAVILRANGRSPGAARAEQFALRIGLRLDEPQATRRMQSLADALYGCSHTGVLLERALDGAMSLIGAELGNIQICNAANGTLRIAAQAGFDSEFLEYFAAVKDETSACGRAASRCAQTVVVDVNEDAAFAPHRDVAAASRFRAVQSTPLVDPDGRLRGVISTHFRHSHRPCNRDLQLMQWYGEQVAAALVAGQRWAHRDLRAGLETFLGGNGIRHRPGAIDGADRDVRV